MLCADMRPRYQVSVYRTIGPLVVMGHQTATLKACFVEMIP